MKSMAILRIGVGVCLALLIGAATFAQTTGTIRGSVKDPSGAVVPGANVTATLQRMQTERTAAAGNDGDYEFAELPVGQYSVGGYHQRACKMSPRRALCSPTFTMFTMCTDPSLMAIKLNMLHRPG